MNRLTSKIIPPDGSLSSRICFVGEAPGEEEDEMGLPFFGQAGQLLNRCLTQVGLARSDVLVHNIFCQRPPRNDIKYFYQDASCKRPTWEGEEHLRVFADWLTKLKDNSDVNVIVALGRTAIFHLTGKDKVEKWRGSVLPCTLVEGFKVYCAYHPSYVNRLINEQEEKLMGDKKKLAVNALPVFLKDLERAKIQSQTRSLDQIERQVSIDLSFEEICLRLKHLSSDIFHVAVDIETLPSENGPLLWCIGFSQDPGNAFVVPFIRGEDCAFTEEQEAEILRLISEVFLSPSVKIFHNAGYDLGVLARYYSLRVDKDSWQDTMWLHHASYPYLKKSLAFCTSVYTWEPYYKDMGKVHFGVRSSDAMEFAYNAKDCCVTREIFPVIMRDAKELNTWSGYRRTIRIFESHLAMTLRGIKIDLEKKSKLQVIFAEKATHAEAEVNRLSGAIWNLRSSQQKQKLLYGMLGLDIQFNRQTKRPSVDKEALQKLKKKYKDNQILQRILDFQRFDKLSTTYAEMIVDDDGRVHTAYRWVSTWRTSSSSSPFVFKAGANEEAGGNLQNIPRATTEEGKAVRALFVADEGKILIASDLSQAEDRVVTWESNNEMKIRQYLDGGKDVHWEYAKMIFEIPDSVKYDIPTALFRDRLTREEHTLKDFRNLGKTIRHATNYDVGPGQFQATLIKEGFFLDLSLCKKLLESAKAKDPHLSEWKRKIREQIKSTRTLTTPLGRKRTFLGRLNDNTYRAAYAFSPQSTVGELLQIGIQNIYERHSDYIDILLNVHDEVIVQVDNNEATISSAVADMRTCLEFPIEINGRPLTIPTEFKIGPSWGDMRGIK
jgi:uracil-DNA glycosylase family 4